MLIVLVINRWPDVRKAITGISERKPGWCDGYISPSSFPLIFFASTGTGKPIGKRGPCSDVQVKIEQDKDKAKNLEMSN